LIRSPLSILFFQAEKAKVSQPFLIRKMLQAPHHPCGPPQDSLKKFVVLLELRSLELDTVLQMCLHQGGVEGEENLPRPVGHALFNALPVTPRVACLCG